MYDFRFTATLIIGGGRDERGNPRPTTETALEGCLIAPQPKSELDNITENSDTYADLYLDHRAVIPKNAKIRTPDSSPMPGLWAVDGDSIMWPLGTQIKLKKES